MDVWIWSIVAAIIATVVGTAIVEVLRAPIRRFLRKRSERKSAGKDTVIESREKTIAPPDRRRQINALESESNTKGSLTDRLFPLHAELKNPSYSEKSSPAEIRITVEVDAGLYETKTLRLKVGSKVEGLATELYGQDFSMYVVDKNGYSGFVNGEVFASLLTVRDKVAIPFDLIIPKSGKWYFVFDARRKQNPREIEFEYAVYPK